MHGAVQSIEYALPESVLSSAELAKNFPEWDVDKLATKTGIQNRHIASENQCASDLGVEAAQKLFESGVCKPHDIDFLLFCTQSPDYIVPTTACMMQDRLNIPRESGALDFNLGCSGYIYGLGLAEGLIASGQASKVLLITAETMSKHIGDSDKACRVLFGDAAAATLISAKEGLNLLGPFVYGTDGRGAKNLIIPGSGARETVTTSLGPSSEPTIPNGKLFMNGSEVFAFAISIVPSAVNKLLQNAELSINDIDLFVFHQANEYLILEIARILQIPETKLQIALREVGNTWASSIPIALKLALTDDKLRRGDKVLVAGFGVGYSWGATIIRWE